MEAFRLQFNFIKDFVSIGNALRPYRGRGVVLMELNFDAERAPEKNLSFRPWLKHYLYLLIVIKNIAFEDDISDLV